MDLTIDDFKDLLFQVWMTQRENAMLRQQLAEREDDKAPASPVPSVESEEDR